MTTDEKINLLLKHISLDFQLFRVLNEKNDNVRKQDFEAALKSRALELLVKEELKSSGERIDGLLKNIQ